MSFMMFGEIQVTYYNKRGVDLFGVLPSRYELKYKHNGVIEKFEGSTLPETIAVQIRKLDVESINAFFD